ncbi:MAG: molybdenum cofactor biosynthesis protein MoaE [Pseudomonadota bacterium]|nr:molybdenum cofactor biosynthesis protein MoaE [Pseudomonadota bacterium]
MAARVSIQHEDFDVGAEVAALRDGDGGIGAVATFIGTVRDRSDGAVVASMELEHYPGMTEASIEAMIDAALARFDIRGARVVHRIGPLDAKEQIVLVAVASAHRGQAFRACEFLMDYLKTQAPFWKKEGNGADARWVDARVADDMALARWGIVAGNTMPADGSSSPPVEPGGHGVVAPR